jgi:hypothetical protein
VDVDPRGRPLPHTLGWIRSWIPSALVIAIVMLATLILDVPSAAGSAPQLTRYPYLTDLVRRHVTVNWATTTGIASASVTFGHRATESCTAHRVSATYTAIVVGHTHEKQWRASISRLRPGRYCYRVFGDGKRLLGARAPSFQRQVSTRSRGPYSFTVFGDWGQVDAGGHNPDQARLMAEIAESPARFAVSTGDVAYPAGNQRNYGDLHQRGADTSAIFGPDFWTVAGSSTPLFNALGNHGSNPTALLNWPQGLAVASSHGRYRMERRCCVNGSTPMSFPSAWYAFNAGRARFYVLEAAWKDSNVGGGSLYRNDYEAHWRRRSDQFRWLKRDLARHPSKVSFAFFHFPLHSSNPHETSDRWLNGRTRLEGFLGRHGVDIVFNGHAHVYQRNARVGPHMPVSYVTGGGGAHLQPVNACVGVDRYSIGWSSSACGSASPPPTAEHVYHFLLVTVHGTKVTVTPTDERGRTFDVRTYDLS